MLDPVTHSTSNSVDQTPQMREGAGAFTVWAYAAWSAPRGWLSKLTNNVSESRRHGCNLNFHEGSRIRAVCPTEAAAAGRNPRIVEPARRARLLAVGRHGYLDRATAGPKFQVAPSRTQRPLKPPPRRTEAQSVLRVAALLVED
jgi:hypothetical protein